MEVPAAAYGTDNQRVSPWVPMPRTNHRHLLLPEVFSEARGTGVKSFIADALADIFRQYGGHETLTVDRISTEIARRWDLMEHGKTDYPPISETYDL